MRRSREERESRRSGGESDEVRKERKDKDGREQAKRDAHMRGIAARLARRPWEKKEDAMNKTAAEVKAMKSGEVKALVRMITTG